MPRFFFNVSTAPISTDLTGIDLPDIQAVKAEAIRAAGEMLKDIAGALQDNFWAMDVTDEDGRTVLSLRFSAIEPDAGAGYLGSGER